MGSRKPWPRCSRIRRELDAAGRVADDQVRAFPVEVDLALADAFLEIQIAEHEGGHFYRGNPSLWSGEAIFSVIGLVTRAFAPLPDRLAAATARMAAIPRFLADAPRTITRCRPAGATRRSANATPPRHCSATACRRGCGRKPRSPEGATDACEAARAAFAGFKQWVSRELPEADAGRESAGSEFLSLLLRRGHWCRTALPSLIAEAEQALAEAHAGLADRLADAGLATWPDAQVKLAELRPTADDYLARFTRVWQQCYDATIAADLVTWPDRPIRYVPIPTHTRDAAPQLYYLFYRSPAAFDHLPVHDYVVTPIDGVPDADRDRRLAAASDSTILLNHVVHHGGLGHHVQNAHAYQSASRIGQVAAIDAASRIAMFGGGTMAEGGPATPATWPRKSGCSRRSTASRSSTPACGSPPGRWPIWPFTPAPPRSMRRRASTRRRG